MEPQDQVRVFAEQLTTEGGQYDLTGPFTAATAPNSTLLYISAQAITPVRYARIEIGINQPGTNTEQCTAQNLSAVITKRTILSGRPFVGSVHMPALPDNFYSAGKLNPLAFTFIAPFANRVKLPVVSVTTTVTYQPVIFHKVPVGGLSSHSITEVFVQDTVRVMRRRTVGRGI